MKERVILVVGDKFMRFAEGKNVITLTQLRGLLSLPDLFSTDVHRIVVLPGQGLRDDDIESILALADCAPQRAHFDLTEWYRVPKRAAASRSHKHRPENTLISEPRQLTTESFELDLLVDEDCELMRDHQSGQHVQGMILFEAARQSLLAVTESFFLPTNGPKYFFVINDMSVNFGKFAFPLDARLRYVIREYEARGTRSYRFAVDIAIEQCGVEAATCTATFTVYEENWISAREGQLAQEVLDSHIASRLQVLAERHGQIAAIAA